MEGDIDGKINGKYPIFDDALAFLWCKMDTCTKDTLLSVMKTFYNHSDIVKSRDLLFSRVPENENDSRRVKHRKAEEILRGMYDIMQAIPTENPPSFLALDLNNIPYIDLTNIDGTKLVAQQNTMKCNIANILAEQEEMRKQMSSIRQLLEGRDNFNASSNAATNQSNTTDENNPAETTLTLRDVLVNNTRRDQPEAGGPDTLVAPPGAATQANTPGGGQPAARTSRGGGQPATRTSRGGGQPASTTSQGGRAPASRTTSRGGRILAARTTSRGGGASTTRTALRGGGTTEHHGRTTNTQNPTHIERSEDSEEEENDGYITHFSRRRWKKKPAITGRKTGTNLRTVNQVKKLNVFVTRFEADLPTDDLKLFVSDLINDEFSLERLPTKFPDYSSFLVTCDDRHRQVIMNPDEWPEGVLIRRYYGRPQNGSREVPSMPNSSAPSRQNE